MEALIFHATESEVALVDLHGPFTTDGRKVKTDLFLPDGLHPNRAGHQCMAEAVVAAFGRHFSFNT